MRDFRGWTIPFVTGLLQRGSRREFNAPWTTAISLVGSYSTARKKVCSLNVFCLVTPGQPPRVCFQELLQPLPIVRLSSSFYRSPAIEVPVANNGGGFPRSLLAPILLKVTKDKSRRIIEKKLWRKCVPGNLSVAETFTVGACLIN